MRKLKITALVLILLLAGKSTFSQEDARFTHSLSVGSNIYNLTGSNNDDDWKFYNIPFFVGYNINYQLNKNISLSSGLMLENVYSKGWFKGNDTVFYDPEYKNLLRVDQIRVYGTIPILFNYSFYKRKLCLSTGILINFFRFEFFKNTYETGKTKNNTFETFGDFVGLNHGLTSKIHWFIFNKNAFRINVFCGASLTNYYPSSYGRYLFIGTNIVL
ncbi:MAG: hypothetical protein ACOCPM_07060 [Bacteroidales bacterium]